MRHLPVVAASLLAPILLAACSGAKARPKVVLDRLNAAVDKGDLNAMRAELAAGADPCAPQSDGRNSLFRMQGRAEIVAELLPEAAKRGCPRTLYFAAQHGKIDMVRDLLNRGASPNEPGPWGPPLTGAASYVRKPSPETLEGKYEAARLLLEKGADPNGGAEYQPLKWSATNGYRKIAELLLDKGAEPGKASLIDAAKRTDAAFAKLLIQRGADAEGAIAHFTDKIETAEYNIKQFFNMGGYHAEQRKIISEARSAIALIRRASSEPSAAATAAAPAAGGMTKEELAGIVQAAVEKAAVAAKAEAAPAKKSYASDADKPVYSRPERPADLAVVVGISKYSDLPEAAHAERDAEAVKDHLIAAGYPSRNVVLLTGEKASRSGLEKFVESWLPRNARPDSRVVFYFSGHGAPEPTSGKAYLVPWDGDPGFLENTAYPLTRLYERLGALPAREVLVALDACFSGVGGRSVLAGGARPLVARAEPAPRPAKVTVLAAASGDEIASTDEPRGHGLFTYQLLAALNAGAKAGRPVTARDAHAALKTKVQDAARRQNRSQTPTLEGPEFELLR